MKVVLVNHSDTRGGASVVTLRLMEALRSQGIDARMLVMHKATDNPNIEVVGSALSRKANFLKEHLSIYLRNGLSRADLFKTSIGTCGVPIHKHPWIKEADVVVLNWVNQGMMSLKDISRIKAPVVWTMHDMWPMTGVCHHAGECIEYKRLCGGCRLLHSGSSADDLSRSTLQRKQDLYRNKRIHFVAVSNWLAEKARGSSLLRAMPLSVIHNAFPIDSFSDVAKYPRSHYGLPEGHRLIVMGAARLDDPIKGLDIAVEALNMVTDTKAMAVFFGNLKDKHALNSLRLPYVWLGPVTDQQTLADIYAHADIVLSTSHYETLPGTLIEGMAAGCVPVTFGRGGQRDIVDHMRTGYIAVYPNAENIAEGIRYVLAHDFDKALIRQEIADKFAADNIAAQYIQLFNQLTK